MSHKLSSRDAAQVLAVVQDVWPPNESFRDSLVKQLRELLNADVCSLNSVDLASGAREMVTDPPAWAERMSSLSEGLDEIVQQHPLVELFMTSPRLGALRLSDLPRSTRWTESDLYQRYYLPLGLRWQMVLPVPSADRHMHVISVNRTDPDFTDREIALCEAFLPMLALGLGGAPSPGDLRLDVAGGWRLVRLTEVGAVASVAPEDANGRLAEGLQLPAEVLEATHIGDSRSTVRTIVGGEGWLFRFLGHTRLGPIFVAGPVSEAAASLPRLTPRQAEVLELIAQGKTNEGIASELGIAVGTARKHVENLTATLGVPNRAAAAALVSRAREQVSTSSE